jgi:hypothetical protein
MNGKSVSIELGGKTRTLVYDFNALVELEEKIGVGIQDFMKMVTTGARLKDLRGILWAGLIHDEPGLTPEGVGAMITSLSDFTAIGQSVKAAMEAAFPAPEPKATIPGRRNRVPKN